MTAWFPRLLVVTACTQFVVCVVRPVLTYQALALGASTSQVGIVVASFSTISLLAAIPVGRAIDRRGERGFLLVGAVLLAATVAGLAMAPRLWILVVGSAVLGLGQLVTMVACQTLIANGRDGRRRDGRFATFTLVTSTAQFSAPAVAGFLVGSHASAGGVPTDFGAAYAVAAAAGLVGAGAALWLSQRPAALAARPAPAGSAAPGAVTAALRERVVAVAMVVGFTVLSSADLLVAFLPALGADRGMSPRVVGLLIASHGLAAIIVRLFLMVLLRRCRRSVLLAVCLGTAAVSLGSVPFVTWLPGLYVLMFCSGAGIGLCQPIAIGWVAGAVPPQIRGTAMSVRMAGNRLGQTVVPLVVAALAGAAGVAAAFAVPAALLVVSAGLVLGARADDDRPPGTQTEPQAG